MDQHETAGDNDRCVYYYQFVVFKMGGLSWQLTMVVAYCVSGLCWSSQADQDHNTLLCPHTSEMVNSLPLV